MLQLKLKRLNNFPTVKQFVHGSKTGLTAPNACVLNEYKIFLIIKMHLLVTASELYMPYFKSQHRLTVILSALAKFITTVLEKRLYFPSFY